MQTSPKATVLVACRVMEPELEELRRERCHVEVLYLEQSLHRTPQKMAERVQALSDQAAGRAQQIVLGYGLCSNADFLNMRYEEITGDCLPYFKKLFDGPYSEDEFIRIPPEAEMTREIFFSEMS